MPVAHDRNNFSSFAFNYIVQGLLLLLESILSFRLFFIHFFHLSRGQLQVPHQLSLNSLS